VQLSAWAGDLGRGTVQVGLAAMSVGAQLDGISDWGPDGGRRGLAADARAWDQRRGRSGCVGGCRSGHTESGKKYSRVFLYFIFFRSR
jgi:hypothetical protein